MTLCAFIGNIDSDLFYAWMVNDLLAKVAKGAVIVMDNAAFHKRKDIHNSGDKITWMLY